MTLIDEFTRQCLAIRVARRINGLGVIEVMADAMIAHGVPEHRAGDIRTTMGCLSFRGGQHALTLALSSRCVRDSLLWRAM